MKKAECDKNGMYGRAALVEIVTQAVDWTGDLAYVRMGFMGGAYAIFGDGKDAGTKKFREEFVKDCVKLWRKEHGKQAYMPGER